MSIATGRSLSEPDPPPDPQPHPPRGFTLPRGATDCHAHVVGPEGYIPQRSYTPHPAPAEAYLRMLDATGMDRGVLVQVSVHGSDNRLLMETLKQHPRRLRGIAVAPHDLPEAGWRALKESGVVGLRLNTTTGGGVGTAALEQYEAICLELGWHLQFLVEAAQIPALAPRIARLRVPAVFDHMGYVRPSMAGGEAARTLLQLVRDGAWAKLSGGFRISQSPAPYHDTVAFAAALAEAGPGRCVWGSDWPHVSFGGVMPNPGDLLDLLAQAVPDEAARQAVLVDNPARLYGFELAGTAQAADAASP
ncbi:amidohydrolase family protein [Xylophilus rhododendri]|uniref:Amidohydrolase family protein n=1 Tax=Xylophilus rhododendri TaxID=2697032 RepID=A0A857J0T6_9BURK|nr:amidohydrolase family protein [Xylophilus rhododendri]QHI97480.1 amidohydrolase family protein [Xylophilus rhododendri]